MPPNIQFPSAGLSAKHLLAHWVDYWSLVVKWVRFLITYLAAAYPTPQDLDPTFFSCIQRSYSKIIEGVARIQFFYNLDPLNRAFLS